MTQAEIDADGDLSNIVTADSVESAPDTDTKNIPISQNPAIHVAKSSTTTSVSNAGQVVPYVFSVHNIGNMTLSGITVTDPKCDAAPVYGSGDTNTNSQLEVTETWVYTCNHTVTQAEIDADGDLSNIVTADSVESAPDTDTKNIPISQNPAIHVAKSSTTTSVSNAGQVVPYVFSVHNIGNMTLSGITVTDPNCRVAPAYQSGDTKSDSKLQTTETWTLYLQPHSDAGGDRCRWESIQYGDGGLNGERTGHRCTCDTDLAESGDPRSEEFDDGEYQCRGAGGAVCLQRSQHWQHDPERDHGDGPEM